MRRSLDWLVTVSMAALLLAAGCASMPSGYPPPPHTVALKPDPTTFLGGLAADFARGHGEGVSGYAAVDRNGDGLRWRLALVDSAERSLDMLYYLWYGDAGGLLLLEHVIEAAGRGVRVRILTNSLASNDMPAVTSKYKKYRKALLEAGVELYEFRAHPEIQAGMVDTEPVTAEFSGLHIKAAVIDRRIVYIGSLNLDRRSIVLNTEMGMLVSSPGLAEEVARIAERDMGPANSWRVGLDEDGDLYWESAAGRVARQPARSGWQRIEMWFLGIAPESQL